MRPDTCSTSSNGADSMRSRTTSEAADKNPATKQYVDLVKKNGGDISALGMNAASSFLLWATQVKACGAALTRQCVLDKAAAVHDWSGGLQGSPGADVGGNKPSICEVVLSLQGTKWVQADPADLGMSRVAFNSNGRCHHLSSHRAKTREFGGPCKPLTSVFAFGTWS